MKTTHIAIPIVLLTIIFVTFGTVQAAQFFPSANYNKTYKINSNTAWKEWNPVSNILVAADGGSLIEYSGNGTKLGTLYENKNFSISNIRFNHDGTKLAFLNDYTTSGGPLDIYVLDLKNNQLSQLTHGAHVQGLAWTPDGNMIYADENVNNWWHFKILKLELKNNSTSVILDQMTAFGGLDISPDGKKLVFSQITTCNQKQYSGCTYGLFIYDLESGNKTPTALTIGLTPQDPRWSYDGSFITYSYINEFCGPIKAITPDGNITANLIWYNVTSNTQSCNGLAVMNRDGTIIAYDSDLGLSSGGMFFTYTNRCAINSCQFTIPEFPFSIPVLLLGITSLIIFYKIKLVFCPVFRS